MASVTFTGQAAIVAAMRQATVEIRARVGALIETATSRIISDHRAKMPRSQRLVRPFRDKPLADRVFRRVEAELRQVVVSDAPHLHLIELGTADRYARTIRKKSLTKPRFTGRVPKPAAQRFVPMAIARRIEFLESAQALIEDREF